MTLIAACGLGSLPAEPVAWVSSKGGLVRLRPDHTLAITREMGVSTRLRFARDTLEVPTHTARLPMAA